MSTELLDEQVCLTENCGKPRKWRGLCSSCYGVARNLINDGKTTWEELAQLGLVILDEKPFYAAFRKRKLQGKGGNDATA